MAVTCPHCGGPLQPDDSLASQPLQRSGTWFCCENCGFIPRYNLFPDTTSRFPWRLLLAGVCGLGVVGIGICFFLFRFPHSISQDEILGTWTNSNRLDTLEFQEDGKYRIRDELGRVGKAGTYQVLNGRTLVWQDTRIIRGGGRTPVARTERTVLRASIKGGKLVLSCEGESSTWHR